MIRLTCAPDFVEEAVLLAEPSMPLPDRRAFRRARDPLYRIPDEYLREDRFRALHEEWFARLGFGRLLKTIVTDTPGLEPGVGEARVLRALTRNEEGADLVDQVVCGQSGTRPVLVVRLRSSALADVATLRAFLGHELMHVCDMLDPSFGYQRALPPCDADGLTETILRDRYRVVWDTTIDGRLARAGRLPPAVEAIRRREFDAIFRMLGSESDSAFDAWFRCERPTHGNLLTFIRKPGSLLHEACHAYIG